MHFSNKNGEKIRSLDFPANLLRKIDIALNRFAVAAGSALNQSDMVAIGFSLAKVSALKPL